MRSKLPKLDLSDLASVALGDAVAITAAVILASVLRMVLPFGEPVAVSPTLSLLAWVVLLGLGSSGSLLIHKSKFHSILKVALYFLLSIIAVGAAYNASIGTADISSRIFFACLIPIMFVLLLLVRAKSLLTEKTLKFINAKTPPISAIAARYPWFAAVQGFLHRHRNWLPPVILIVVAALFFWPKEFPWWPDVGTYLSLAKSLFHGNGYVNPDLSPFIYRGPVFPLLLSGGYVAFGESFHSALLVQRVLWLLTIFAVWYLGKVLFGKRVGFLAGLLAVFAGAINVAFTLILSDGPLLLGLLAVQILCWDIYKRNRSIKWYVLLGILMGIVYLVKESALFLVPLPMLMWLLFTEYRTRRNLINLLVCYAIFICFPAGWVIYVLHAGGSEGQAFSHFRNALDFIDLIRRSITSIFTGTEVASSGADVRGAVRSPLAFIKLFYSKDISADFKNAAIFFSITLLFTLYQAIWKKNRADIQLGLGILLFASLIPAEVNASFGARNNVYFYAMMLIASAAMIVRLMEVWRLKEFDAAAWLGKSLSIGTIAMVEGLLIAGLVMGPVKRFPGLALFSLSRFAQPVVYFTGPARTAEWIDKNVGADESILITPRDGNYLHILTSGNRRFESLNLCIGEASFQPAIPCRPPYLFFWLYRGSTNPDRPRDRFFGISESWLLSEIRQKSVDYVIVTPSVYMLSDYLEAHPDFEEAARIGRSVIFRVLQPPQPISTYPITAWENCIGRGTSEYLSNLKKENPEAYEAKITEFFGPWMGLTKQDILAYEDWHGCQVEPPRGQ